MTERFPSTPRLNGSAGYATESMGGGPDPVARRSAARPDITFIMEQQVGLRTYSDNLRRFVDLDPRINATWVPITYHQPGGLLERVPLLPESLTGSLRGWTQVRAALRHHADATCFLTQIPVALGGRRSRRKPYVVMMDCTPVLLDAMADAYQMPSGSNRLVAGFKQRVNRLGLNAAYRLFPMSHWAQQSLIEHYGVDPERTLVLAAGIDVDRWTPSAAEHAGPVRILFVGGDFDRKGGADLLTAFERLPEGRAELRIVTRSELEPRPGITVYHDMQPNTPELIDLFRTSDVFVLPSRAEAFPNVIMEASATGLPCVVTNVGANGEMVIDGQTGFVFEPGDIDRLVASLCELLDDSTRSQFGRAARTRAESHFDGRANASIVVDQLLAAATQAGGRG